MDDRELYEGLKPQADQDQEWAAAAEHFVRLRQAPPEEPSAPAPPQEKRASLREVIETAKNPKALPFLLGGAALLGAGTAVSSAPRKSLGGRSLAEADLGGMIDRQSQGDENKSGLATKLKNRTVEFAGGAAKALRQHPVKATALGALSGVSAGAHLARLLGVGK